MKRTNKDLNAKLYNEKGEVKMNLKEIEEENVKDIISLKDSELNEQLLIEKKKRVHYGIIVAIFTQVVWALMAVQLKTYSNFFPNAYSRNSVILWRSVPIGIIGYIIAIKKNQKIKRISEITYKTWFFIRELGNYFILSLFIYLFNFFRVGTCQCIYGCHSIFVLYFSIVIIHEPFYMRYLIGLIMSIVGSCIIVLNDRGQNKRQDSENNNIIIGSFFALIYVLFLSCSKFAQKMLCKENLSGELQNMYLGILNTLPALLVAFYEKHIGLNFLYISYAMSNGVLFYIANYYTAVCFNNMPVATFLPLVYFNQIFTFIFGWILLGERVYFSDIIGSLLIFGFQIYDIFYPRVKLPKK